MKVELNEKKWMKKIIMLILAVTLQENFWHSLTDYPCTENCYKNQSIKQKSVVSFEIYKLFLLNQRILEIWFLKSSSFLSRFSIINGGGGGGANLLFEVISNANVLIMSLILFKVYSAIYFSFCRCW